MNKTINLKKNFYLTYFWTFTIRIKTNFEFGQLFFVLILIPFSYSLKIWYYKFLVFYRLIKN